MPTTLTRPVSPVKTAIATRYLNLITIQSKAVDFENVPEETITIEVPSDEPLTLQQRRQAYWEKRWTHVVVSHTMTDLTVEPDNWF
jgi:hypothetical protein